MLRDLNWEIKAASRTQIYDGQKTRFEVPHEHVKTVINNSSSSLENVLELKRQPFGLTVNHMESSKVV